jgi:hypothetical protein
MESKAMRLLRTGALCLLWVSAGCFGGPGDHVGAYDGTWTDTYTANGQTSTDRQRQTLYFLEAEEGAAVYVPGLDCVLEASFDGGALEVDGQRCSKVNGQNGYDYRLDGDGTVEDGELELELRYTATITQGGQAIQVSGSVDFKGDLL